MKLLATGNSHCSLDTYPLWCCISEEELANTESMNNILDKSSDMLNKKAPRVQKGGANQKQQLSDYTCNYNL